MAARKASKASTQFLVVPNAKRWRTNSAQKKSALRMIGAAAEKNRNKKSYQIISTPTGKKISIRDKKTGRLVASFSVREKSKNLRVRKFVARPRSGTISPQKIFESV